MSREKGQRRERQYATILDRAGYDIQPFRGTPYGETDGFGLYDLLAIKPADGNGPTVRLVQVKSNEATGIREWATVAGRHRGMNVIPEYAVCHDRQGWRVMQPVYTGGEWTYRTRVDERDEACAMGEIVEKWLNGGSNGC